MNDAVSTKRTGRRGDIIDAATRLFGAHGYGSTTTDQIADAALITKRTLYRHTGSKEQILLLIHERFLDAVDAVGVDWGTGSAAERFRHFVDAYLKVVVAHQDAIRVFYEEMKNLSQQSRAIVVERRDTFERSVRELIADGVSDKEFENVDVPLMTLAILGGLANCYRWYSPEGPASGEQIATIASELFLGGLAKPTNGPTSAAEHTTPPEPDELIANATDDVITARRLPPSIMVAALALFVENGYLETSTREIAARAGITKSALFYHIGSKEELLFAIQEEFGQKSLAMAAAHLGYVTAPEDVVGALRKFFVAHCEIINTDRHAVEIFIDQFRYLEGDHRDRIVRMRDRYTAVLELIIEYGVASGVLRAPSPKVATLVIIGMLNSIYRWYDPAGRLSATEIGEKFADLILDGLLRGPEKE